MSTPAAGYEASLALKQYFCYQCNRTVAIYASAAAAGELSCPSCGGAFLEEVTAAAPSIHSFAFSLTPSASSPPQSSASSTAAPPTSHLSNFITSFLNLQDGRRARSSSASGAASAVGTATPENEPESFDPLVFFQNYIRGLEEGGANIHVLLDGARVDGARVDGSFRDYVDGPGLEQLMEHIADNHPNRRGTPPATKSALSTLRDVVLTNAMVADGADCAVCIIRWLGLHNSCPLCRFQLTTDDPDDEGNNASDQQPSSAISLSSTTTEEGAGTMGMLAVTAVRMEATTRIEH